MKLTPLDIRHREFRRGIRGYADEEVDLFLDEVADEFERLFRENIEAQEKIERLQEKVSEFDQLKETLQHTLVTAQQQADEVRANARKEAELMLRDGELKGRDILADSYSEKQRVQQSLIQLRQVEEDFRFKFRSLLEAHINLLTEDESSEDRRWFRGVVSTVEEEIKETPAASEPREEAAPARDLAFAQQAPSTVDEDASAWQPSVDISSPEPTPASEPSSSREPSTPAQTASVIWDSPVVTETGSSDDAAPARPDPIREAVDAAKASSGLDSASVEPVYEANEDEEPSQPPRPFVWGRHAPEEGIRTDASDGKGDQDFSW